MVWKQITDFDSSRDVVLSIQNTSLVAHSKVHISLTESNQPNPASAFVLTGPNQWTQRIPAGTKVFYAEEDGGIIGYWFHYIAKLVNYDIPFSHEDRIITNHSFTAVEGSYLTVQNKSEEPIYIGIGGTGSFVITQYQVMSWTFAKDTEINMRSNSASASISIGQSPNVTLLSEETRKMLEDMQAKVDGLIESAATKDELKTVHQRTYFGQWSPLLPTSSSDNTSEIVSDIFMKDNEYRSNFPDGRQVLDVLCSVTYMRPSSENDRADVNETSLIKLSVLTEDSGDTNQVLDYYCGTPWFNFNINKVEVRRDITNGKLNVRIGLKTQIKGYIAIYAIRVDDAKFLQSPDGEILNEKIAIYQIDKDNSDINFTTDSFYVNNILGLFRYGLNPKKESLDLNSYTNSSVGGTQTQTLLMEQNSSIRLVTKSDGSDANLELSLPSDYSVSRLLGLNIRNKDKTKKNGIFLDLITMSNGSQNKSSMNGVDTILIPLWKHSIYGYAYIVDEINKIDDDESYYVELIFE